MRILLDTHLVLWTLTGDAQLGTLAQQLLLDAGNQIYVSAASVWEVTVKHRKHPAIMPMGPRSRSLAASARPESCFEKVGLAVDRHAAGLAKIAKPLN